MKMNKDIELCGLGNALLDLQYEIDDATLIELKLKKGEMTLVSSEHQKELIEKLKDCNHYKSSGGSAANTVIAFSQFGGKAAYMTLLGDDENGKFYSEEFTELNIELETKYSTKEPTGTCLVLITPDSERTMVTSLGASAGFSKNDISEDLIKRSVWLYVEGYKFSQESSTEAVYFAMKIAKKYDTKIAVTFSDVFITENFKNNLHQLVKNSDLIFCNENEAKSFTNTDNANDALKVLINFSPNVVITKGGQGSIISWNKKIMEIPPYDANPIDSTGAGDMYAGGFFYGLNFFESVDTAGNLASYASAKIISQFGARLKEDHKNLIEFVKEEKK